MKTILDSVLIGFLGLGGPEMIVILFIGIIVLLPTIFYLITLQKTLKEVSEENRKLPAGQVWLILIPLFGLIWQYIVVNRIANSLKAEFAKRNITIEQNKPGIGVGLAYCSLHCFRLIIVLFFAAMVISKQNNIAAQFIPLVGLIVSTAAFIFWIIYWVKIADYKSRLIQ